METCTSSITHVEVAEEVEVDTDCGASDASEAGFDQLIYDLIEAQERLNERENEIINKDEELKGFRQLVDDLKTRLEESESASRRQGGGVSSNQEEIILNFQHPATNFQKTIDKITAELEEKDRQLRAKDWDNSRQKGNLEIAILNLKLEGKEQDSLRQEIALLKQQLSTANKTSVTNQEVGKDASKQQETPTAQIAGKQADEIARLRSLVQFFKSNSESVAIKNKELTEENKLLKEKLSH
ncbi:hypothetical protein K505DRAFT_333798 [Melanomma pulvis-pyrius CBS 109.77]|uniref:Uncharacterized protein n=1 Tax=Melanomma pulvis-pyrius CBS 109.77 TaxID=1314802 RepID=A0A6A6XNE2_9PLEO|nr:hypothetical protein K505DRAFT_333798 [Melanomma pulvis-pyrius CBS 109.77]